MIGNLRRIGALLLLCLMMAPGAFAQPAPLVMKLGTATANDSNHEWLKIFANHITSRAGTRIQVEIYPASQLGTSPRMIEQTQLGTIQGVAGAPEFLAGVNSRYQLLGAPGLFKDMQHTNRVLQDPDFNSAFLGLGSDKGLIGVSLMIGGPTVFVTRKPVRKLVDLEQLKIRTLPGRLHLEQTRKLKASPIPMALGEVLPALQQGTLDGAMSTTSVFVGLRYYDAAKYLAETNHSVIASIIVISKRWYDQLPQDLKSIVVEAGQKAANEVFPIVVSEVQRDTETWTKSGGEVTRLEPAERAQMMTDLVSVGAQVTANNPQEKAMFDKLRSVAEKEAR